MSRFFSGSILCGWLLFAGCQGNSVTDKLQGKWQLKTVEQAGRVTDVDTVWYNFESESLFMYQIYWAEKDTFIHRYGYRVQPEDDVMELILDDSNKEVPLSRFLPYTDWDTGIRVFVIEEIGGKRLTLRNNDQVYLFTKYE